MNENLGYSQLDKERGNKIYAYMKGENRACTKEELCNVLGWPYNSSNDRKIRDLLSILKKRCPIIATPDQKGYKLAMSADDVESVIHQWRYIDKFMKELEETKVPLKRFLDKMR